MNTKHLDLARAFSTARHAAKTTAAKAGLNFNAFLSLNTSSAPWANRVMSLDDFALTEIEYAGYDRQPATLVAVEAALERELGHDICFPPSRWPHPIVVTHITVRDIASPLLAIVRLNKAVILQPGESFRLARGWSVSIQPADWRLEIL